LYTLITAATTARAQKLKNSLAISDVILGDYHQLPEFMLKTSVMIKLPNPSSLAYAHQMLTLCLDKQINVIYALADQEYLQLAAAGQLFSEYGISIIGPQTAFENE
jgi:hypothetical protein